MREKLPSGAERDIHLGEICFTAMGEPEALLYFTRNNVDIKVAHATGCEATVPPIARHIDETLCKRLDPSLGGPDINTFGLPATAKPGLDVPINLNIGTRDGGAWAAQLSSEAVAIRRDHGGLYLRCERAGHFEVRLEAVATIGGVSMAGKGLLVV